MPARVLPVRLSRRDESPAALQMQDVFHRRQRSFQRRVSARLASLYVRSEVMIIVLPGRHSAESSFGHSSVDTMQDFHGAEHRLIGTAWRIGDKRVTLCGNTGFCRTADLTK
jgi:hypothetical protein